MHFIKLVLLVHFLQMLYEVHALLLCYEKDIDEITHQTSCINAKSTSREIFQTLLNYVVLHEYQMSLVYDLMLTMELSDYVRIRSTTRFTHFLMMQYNDFKWIEHFRIMRKFVRQLTKKLKPLMWRRIWHTIAQFLWQFELHILCTSLFMVMSTCIVVNCLPCASLYCVSLFHMWIRCFEIKLHGWKEKTWLKSWMVLGSFAVF
jgi:hypothetical protein